jgi:hypothetical protein
MKLEMIFRFFSRPFSTLWLLLPRTRQESLSELTEDREKNGPKEIKTWLSSMQSPKLPGLNVANFISFVSDDVGKK